MGNVLILTKSNAMEEQHQGGGQGPSHGVHHDVGDHIDGGDQEGKVDRGAANQGNLRMTYIIKSAALGVVLTSHYYPCGDLSSSPVSGANSVKIIPPQAHTTLFKMSGQAASCGVKCIRHIPDHTGGKKSAF